MFGSRCTRSCARLDEHKMTTTQYNDIKEYTNSFHTTDLSHI